MDYYDTGLNYSMVYIHYTRLRMYEYKLQE